MSIIVSVSLETGDLTQFTGTSGDGCSVLTGAKMGHTNYGMNVNINDATPAYGQVALGSPDSSGSLECRFYFDPNTISMNAADDFYLLRILSSAPAAVANIRLYRHAGGYYLLNINYVTDAGAETLLHQYVLSDAPHVIEFKLTKSSGANDGIMTCWLDEVDSYTVSNIDNDTKFSNFATVRVGFVAVATDVATSGDIFVDELIVNNDGTYIGAVSALCFGFNLPTANESPVSWDNQIAPSIGWSDGAGSQQSVSGDASWGKLELADGEEGRSQVYDMGDAYTRTFTLTENAYGTGQGDADLEIRGSDSSFAQDDALPAWNAYVGPTTQAWRYIQVRESRE